MIETLHPIPETAKILHCSPSQVLALIRKGKLRALKHTRPYLIPESEITRFIKEELERCAGSSGPEPTAAIMPVATIDAAARSSATRSALMTLTRPRSGSTASSSSTKRCAMPTRGP
jgi:excisionase family DNA binding protein